MILVSVLRSTRAASSSEKGAFKNAQNTQIQIYTAHAQRIILLADTEGSDLTERMRRLVWTFAVRISLETRFHMALPIKYCRISGKVIAEVFVISLKVK